MNELTVIKAKYDKIIFQSADMSYMVVIYEEMKTRNSFTAVGAMLPAIKGTQVTLKGRFVEAKKYGRQFQVDEVEEERPSEANAIEDYLVDAKIKGIGKTTAAKIARMFGEETFSIIENKPTQLTKIRGINLEKAEKISEDFKSKSVMREAIMTAKKLGLSANIANKIYGKFGAKSTQIMEEQPYMLCFIQGISFSTIDQSMKRRKSFNPCNGSRIQAAINQTLLANEMKGHLFIEPQNLAEDVYRMLNAHFEEVGTDLIKKAINYCVSQKMITFTKGAIYRNGAFKAEQECAEKIAELLMSKIKKYEISGYLETIQGHLGYDLAEKQKKAVQMVFQNPLSIITGGPGRGKTTVIKAILEVYERINKKVGFALCAPTGKAARRMTESTGKSASTIHSLLGLMDENFDELNTIDVDCVIADEFSMADQYLARAFFGSLEPGTRVILVGDKDQLPSVRAGNVFREMIECGVIPVTVLDVVYRQEDGNSIILNSDKMNEGNTELLFDAHTMFLSKKKEEHIAEAILNCMIEERSSFSDDEIQILTPYKRSTKIGSDSLNLLLQDYMNPPGMHKKEIKTAKGIWRIQDKVMMLKNKEDASNGDTGRIVMIVNIGSEPYMEVQFDTKVLRRYEYSEIDEQLQLNYACTIHKSQGSEYPLVIIPVSMVFENMLKRNLLYTAITRASVRVRFIGDKDALKYAIMHADVDQRKTRLGERVRTYIQEYDTNEPKKLIQPKKKEEKQQTTDQQMSLDKSSGG